MERHALSDGVAMVIPAGTEHNVINTSATEPLRLYTVYSLLEHPDGTVHRTRSRRLRAGAPRLAHSHHVVALALVVQRRMGLGCKGSATSLATVRETHARHHRRPAEGPSCLCTTRARSPRGDAPHRARCRSGGIAHRRLTNPRPSTLPTCLEPIHSTYLEGVLSERHLFRFSELCIPKSPNAKNHCEFISACYFRTTSERRNLWPRS
jgi:hypothetical protein